MATHSESQAVNGYVLPIRFVRQIRYLHLSVSRDARALTKSDDGTTLLTKFAHALPSMTVTPRPNSNSVYRVSSTS